MPRFYKQTNVNRLIKWLNHLEKAPTIHLEGWRQINLAKKKEL